jgi:FKBP-type peptidyl-prolyl cis-trans isomerase FklB
MNQPWVRVEPGKGIMFLVVALAICWLTFVSFARAAGAQGPAEPDPEARVFENPAEKLSYALGIDFGRRLRHQGADVHLELLIQGLKDALTGTPASLTEKEIRAALKEAQSELRRKQSALRREKALKNKEEGEAFLAANQAREGIVTLESGLQYKILESGHGPKPTLDDTVVCHYRGTALDGTEFASSYASNQPATFKVKRVINGWKEALQLMPVGSKWRLFIPPKLAYGERGAGPGVGPNATLVFDVELITIKGMADNEAHASEIRTSINPAVAGVTVSFKLDPRLTQGVYLGERWISSPKYTCAQQGKTCTLEARAQGIDARRRAVKSRLEWIPSDPEMVTVTPGEGKEVQITVHRPGESRLRLTSQGVSKELTIKAHNQGDALLVEIAQEP